MKAAINEEYGPAEKVVRIGEVERPEIRDNEVLVQVFAASVSTGQWRMVEMNAEGVLQLAARLMMGVFRPRNTIQGGSLAGRVVSVGGAVTKFKLGDEVFGFVMNGSHAEYVAVPEDKALTKMPEGISYAEAAALPFGGLCALNFLRDFAKLRPGQRVLVTGASGGVGVFGVQIAKHLGAEVTGLASTDNVEMVRSLGADHVIDYKKEDFTKSGQQFDIVFDTAGVTDFASAKNVLAPGGQFVPLEFGLREALQSIRSDWQGRRVIIGVNGDSAEDLAILAGLTTRGAVRPVIDSTYTLANIVDGYKRVASRHKRGAVIIDVALPKTLKAAAE